MLIKLLQNLAQYISYTQHRDYGKEILSLQKARLYAEH